MHTICILGPHSTRWAKTIQSIPSRCACIPSRIRCSQNQTPFRGPICCCNAPRSPSPLPYLLKCFITSDCPVWAYGYGCQRYGDGGCVGRVGDGADRRGLAGRPCVLWYNGWMRKRTGRSHWDLLFLRGEVGGSGRCRVWWKTGKRCWWGFWVFRNRGFVLFLQIMRESRRYFWKVSLCEV